MLIVSCRPNKTKSKQAGRQVDGLSKQVRKKRKETTVSKKKKQQTQQERGQKAAVRSLDAWYKVTNILRKKVDCQLAPLPREIENPNLLALEE